MTKKELKDFLIKCTIGTVFVGALVIGGAVAFNSVTKQTPADPYNPNNLVIADITSRQIIGMTSCQKAQLLLYKGMWRDTLESSGINPDETAADRLKSFGCTDADRVLTLPTEEQIQKGIEEVNRTMEELGFDKLSDV